MGFSLKSVGKFFNDFSGATSASQQSYKYNKEFAQNAHQWEVADMEKAGLNPILSADGSGATGNVSPVQGSGGQMATGLLNSILDYNIMGEQNKIAQQDVNAKSELATAEKEKTQAQTIEQILRNKNVPDIIKADLAQKWAQTNLLNQQTDLAEQETHIANWNRQTAAYTTDKTNWEASNEMWNAIKNESDVEFMKKYHVTKDQAIEIYKATGNIIGNLIKPTNNTPITSAEKQNKKEPYFDKKGKQNVRK